MTGNSIEFRALQLVREVRVGASLARLTLKAMQREGLTLQQGDIVVFAQKVVSKSEGRGRKLAGVAPSSRAIELAGVCGKDPRVVELVLQESSDVVRVAPGVLITRHRLGFVLANAGIDHSNAGAGPDGDLVYLLPEDPDLSARTLQADLHGCNGVAPGVIISDSFGRPWRLGTVNVAPGVARLPALVDHRGSLDRDGRTLQMTQVAVADALCAGAGLVMGEGAKGTPIVLVRGYRSDAPCNDSRALISTAAENLFR